MLNDFFGKSVFSEETAKNCSGGTHFGEPACVITFGPTCIPTRWQRRKMLEKGEDRVMKIDYPRSAFPFFFSASPRNQIQNDKNKQKDTYSKQRGSTSTQSQQRTAQRATVNAVYRKDKKINYNLTIQLLQIPSSFFCFVSYRKKKKIKQRRFRTAKSF